MLFRTMINLAFSFHQICKIAWLLYALLVVLSTPSLKKMKMV